MMTIPLNEKAVFVVIEPANLVRLKRGKPLMVHLPNGGEAMIAFTPDFFAFLRKLGFVPESVAAERGHPKWVTGLKISAEQISTALRDCSALPEVERE